MAAARMVCKHCGGDRFHAEVRAEATLGATGVWLGDDGRPEFEPGGHLDYSSGDDYDVEEYVCSGCDRRSYRLESLVVAPPPVDEPIAACGRCDHGRIEHADLNRYGRPSLPEYYERPAMPCHHDGCDCHDYYDLAVAEAGQPQDVLAVVGRPPA